MERPDLSDLAAASLDEQAKGVYLDAAQEAGNVDLPEWADDAYISPKSSRTYYVITEPQGVAMRTADGTMAGYITFDPHGHEIGNVSVREDYRREGIATEMFRRAREANPQLQHSDRLSRDAVAWIASAAHRAVVEGGMMANTPGQISGEPDLSL